MRLWINLLSHQKLRLKIEQSNRSAQNCLLSTSEIRCLYIFAAYNMFYISPAYNISHNRAPQIVESCNPEIENMG